MKVGPCFVIGCGLVVYLTVSTESWLVFLGASGLGLAAAWADMKMGLRWRLW